MKRFRTKMLFCLVILQMMVSLTGNSSSKSSQDVLVLVENASIAAQLSADIQNSLTPSQRRSGSVQVEILTDKWLRIQGLGEDSAFLQSSQILHIQPNYKLSINMPWKIQDRLRVAAMKRAQMRTPEGANFQNRMGQDNPEIPLAGPQANAVDPLIKSQWGMLDIGANQIWSMTQGDPKMIVAVIDTGVDYTHEDLLPNLWRNTGETGTDSSGRDKSTNGIDDDENGYIDDVIGWDFVTNDNKPYDLSGSPIEVLQGANPGHGTHCAGNVAAAGNNAKGISGVAPKVSIMSIRFIGEKGQGTTADAVKAIHYAVDNGARVLSNSWGSEGDDPADSEGNKALKDAIQYSQEKGVLFIAAAGNGHQGVGYDNDTDPKPAVPASYDHDIIISVAAIDSNNKLGGFSNWGKKSVDLAAPGVKVFSTVVDNKYTDIALDYFGFKATWDGTSMATPHVAGAAALYWSAHPEKTWQEVKAALLGSVTKLPEYENKLVTGGKLNVLNLMKTSAAQVSFTR